MKKKTTTTILIGMPILSYLWATSYSFMYFTSPEHL